MILKYVYKFTSVSYRCKLICIQAIDIDTMFFFIFSFIFAFFFSRQLTDLLLYQSVLQLLVHFSSVIKQWKSQSKKIGTVKNMKRETDASLSVIFPFLKIRSFI